MGSVSATAVYLDNAATTRVDEVVVSVMVEAMTVDYGNPSSAHRMGVRAARRLETAREQVARALDAEARDIYFTSGGTEANALGVLGVAAGMRIRAGIAPHVLLSALEHPSVAEATARLGERGFVVSDVRPAPNGVVRIEDLLAALRDETALVALMMVSNELGTIQPVFEAARAIKARAPRAHIHVDAVQALGKLPISVAAGPIDSLAVSAHKIHGPKGAGALWLRRGARVASLTVGGGQERGVRPGTEGVPGAVGFGLATERAERARPEAAVHMAALRTRLIERARAVFPSLRVHGEAAGFVSAPAPHIVALGFAGVPSEPLLHALEARGVYVSAGSACASKDKRPSAALRAIGVADDVGTIRFSTCRGSTVAEIDAAVVALGEALRELGR